MKAPFEIQVDCYAGYKADQRPLRFRTGERQFEVVEVLDQWYGPDDTWFRVRADDNHVYVLRCSGAGQSDRWTLEAFQRGAS